MPAPPEEGLETLLLLQSQNGGRILESFRIKG
jgi:hypothetical protein